MAVWLNATVPLPVKALRPFGRGLKPGGLDGDPSGPAAIGHRRAHGWRAEKSGKGDKRKMIDTIDEGVA